MKLANVVVMLVLVALCAVAYFVVSGRSPSGKAVLPAVWPKFERRDVTLLSLKAQSAEVKLRRREGSTDRWDEIIGTELVRADANAVDELLSALSRQSVRERYERKTLTDADIVGYGLDKPTVEAHITVPGEEVLVRYGKLSREGQKVYIDSGPGTDVWIVPKDALDAAISAIANGLKDKRLFDSTLFDVSRFEVVKEGVTVAQLERDRSQIWHFVQPFRGYAHPTKFETELGRVVNVQVEKWEEFDAPDLQKYGLAKPKYEVRITPKGEGEAPEVLLVGDHNDAGGWVKEPDSKAVAMVGKRFFEAVAKDPMEYRDRSFTRLGIDGAGLEVSLGDARYTLEKNPTGWDVVVPGATPPADRHPGDGDRVGRLLDRLREWQTIEFQDARKPEEVGIKEGDATTPATNYVEVTLNAAGREAPGKLTLLFGDSPDGKSVYGMRRGDGGVERVEIGPFEEMKVGPQQYFRKSVAEIPVEAIEEMSREPGNGPEGEKAVKFQVRRDTDGTDKTWRWNETGHTGPPDQNVLREMVAVLHSVVAVVWVSYDPAKDGEAMGFKPGVETLSLSIHLAHVSGIEPEMTLHIGKRRPQGDYFARFVGKGNSNWAFVLDEKVVEVLKKPLSDD